MEYLRRSVEFYPVISHAAAKPINACWRPDSKTSKTKSFCKKQPLNLASSDRCTHIGKPRIVCMLFGFLKDLLPISQKNVVRDVATRSKTTLAIFQLFYARLQ